MGVGCMNGGSAILPTENVGSYRRARNRSRSSELPAISAVYGPNFGKEPAKPARKKRLVNQRHRTLSQRPTGDETTRRLAAPKAIGASSNARERPNCASPPPGVEQQNTAQRIYHPTRPRARPTDAPGGERLARPKQQHDRPLQPRPHGRAPPRRAAVDGGGLPEAGRRAAHDARHSQSVVQKGSTWGNGLRGYDLKYARRVPRVRKFEWGSGR